MWGKSRLTLVGYPEAGVTGDKLQIMGAGDKTHLCMDLYMYVYISMAVCVCVCLCLPACLPARLPACLPTYLPTT